MEAMRWDDEEMVIVDSHAGEMNPVGCTCAQDDNYCTLYVQYVYSKCLVA